MEWKNDSMARGTLRIFLGSAPGVGKTYAMLREGHRLGSAGEDVVVAFARDRGRRDTRELIQGLEVIPARRVPLRGLDVEEMDLDAVLGRSPVTAIVDEYAHTNVQGSRNPHRWQDIDELLDAGIKILPADRIDAALSNYFRPGNLAALRELALLWLADRVDEGLARYRERNGIEASRPARERIVVGLTGGPEGGVLIRRGARILNRINGGDLLAVHVRATEGVAGESPQALEAQRKLVQDLGGSYHIVTGEDPASALLDFARGVNATQIVVGISRPGRLAGLLKGLRGGSVGARVVRDSGDMDVHIVSRPPEGGGTPMPRQEDLGRVRFTVGFLLAAFLPALLQLLLAANPDKNLATTVLIQLTGSVVVALVGGLWPAIAAALWSSLMVNYFSTPPVGNLTISDSQNVLALLVFVGVSAAVATVVDVSARRSKVAARARAEAATLADLSRGAAGSEDTVMGLLEQALDVFQVRGAALFSLPHDDDGGADARDGSAADAGGGAGDGAGHGSGAIWRLIAGVGEIPAAAAGSGDSPGTAGIQGDNVERIDATTCLVLSGRVLPASDRRLLGAFGVHLVAQLERQQLLASRGEVLRLAESNTMRTSILPANMPEVDADPGMLERVIANIVENAVKYAPGSDIVLAGSAGGLSPATVAGRPAGELRIIDHGKGVPADRVLEMFRPFQRLDDAAQATGVGLGLAVAKGFTEAMGGRLTAEATPGGGLTLVISLPLSAGAPFDAHPAQAPLEPQSIIARRHHVPPLLSSGPDAG